MLLVALASSSFSAGAVAPHALSPASRARVVTCALTWDELENTGHAVHEDLRCGARKALGTMRRAVGSLSRAVHRPPVALLDSLGCYLQPNAGLWNEADQLEWEESCAERAAQQQQQQQQQPSLDDEADEIMELLLGCSAASPVEQAPDSAEVRQRLERAFRD